MADQVSYPDFLRLLADFLKEHPTLPQPTLYSFMDGALFHLDRNTAKEQLRSIGEFEKNYSDDAFIAKKKLGGRALEFHMEREAICKKVVTGTRVVPEHYVAGTEGFIKPESIEEIVEWQCDEPILTTEPALP